MLARSIREVLAPTDPAIIEVAAGGERLVARMRVVFWGAVWLVPLVTLVTLQAPPPEVLISFAAATAGLVISFVLVALVRRYRGAPAVAFATTTFDITLVSLTLVAIALAGRPTVAVNSHVVWPVYLLAILATSFRFDYRVCTLAGALSIVQYLLTVTWINARWDLSSTAAAAGYGDVSWPLQIGRMLLQLVATALAAGLVHQGRTLAHVSGRDRLTGLGNRALFEETLNVELARAERSGQPVALAFLDLDHFKRFNDSWGHDAGDAALRAVARVLQNESRTADRTFRWGGEELMVILPDTDAAGAVAHLERIRSSLRNTILPPAPRHARVTVSAGVAEYPRDAQAAETLTLVADRRLLAAKHAGRDRIEAYDEVVGISRAS